MEATISNERYEVYQLAGLGGMLAIGKVPHDASGSANSMVQTALQAVLKFDAAVVRVKQDKGLTAVGRADRLKPDQEAALQRLDINWLLVRKRLGDLAASEAAMVAPPELEDATDALVDREIRERFAAVVGDAKLKLWTELGEGKHPRVLTALLRDPMPSADREQAERLNTQVLSKDADAAALMEGWAKNRADLEWALATLNTMRQKVRDGLGHGVGAGA
jgi:hypothetical protein